MDALLCLIAVCMPCVCCLAGACAHVQFALRDWGARGLGCNWESRLNREICGRETRDLWMQVLAEVAMLCKGCRVAIQAQVRQGLGFRF